MKKYIFLAASALTLASCTSDDFLGDTPGNVESNNVAISFGGETGKISRANDKKGEDAANALGKKFVVYGTKTVGTNTQTVFSSYNVAYGNDNKWNYSTQSNQSIKYWDYSATQYDFVAYSVGSSTSTVRASNISTSGYTLSGKVSDLKNCYIANGVTKRSTDYGKDVEFTFKSTGTKVVLGIYEIISGYSIKDIKFYSSADATTSTTSPALYTSVADIPQDNSEGSLKVTIAENKVATATLEQTESATNSKMISWSSFTLNATKEKSETNDEDDKYLGQTKDQATKSNEITVFPCDIQNGLTLKVDYTLISIDGSGETINVKGATATIDKQYTNWLANYKYTYIFKITENTNGSTGDNTQTGLKPIVFDAVVAENDTQTTETTFDANGTGTTTIQ